MVGTSFFYYINVNDVVVNCYNIVVSLGKMLNGGWGEVATVEATMVLYNSHEWHGNNIWFLQCRILLLLIAG
jgi:hypothetical protein